MPFEHLIPRPFTSSSITMFAPSRPGLYGISNAREWIYIGVADDIKGALLAHLETTDTSVTNRSPTGFVFEICERTRWVARQDQLVREYEPVCARHPTRWRV